MYNNITLDQMNNLSIDEIVNLYRQGYSITDDNLDNQIQSMQYSSYCTGTPATDTNRAQSTPGGMIVYRGRAEACKFTPTSRCLDFIIFHGLKRYTSNGVYFEIRQHDTATNLPKGDPGSSTGRVASIYKNAGDIPTTFGEVTVDFSVILPTANVDYWIVAYSDDYVCTSPTTAGYERFEFSSAGLSSQSLRAYYDNSVPPCAWRGPMLNSWAFTSYKRTYGPPPSPTLTTIGVSPSTAGVPSSIGSVNPTQIFTAIARDQNGDPMSGKSVTWVLSNAVAGTISPTSGTTNINGETTTTFTAAQLTTKNASDLTATSGSISGKATITVYPPRPCPCGQLGDILGTDGKVGADDADALIKYVAGLIQLTPEQLLKADITGSGTVDVGDVLLIYQYIEEMRDTFTGCSLGKVNFTVTSAGVPLSGVSVLLDGITQVTDAQGKALFTNLSVNNTPKTYTSTKAGYDQGSGQLTLDVISKDISVTMSATGTTGTVQASSTPTGAKIYIDGTYRGDTTSTITGVSAGGHTLKLTLTGYNDYTETFSISAGQTKIFDITLTVATPGGGASNMIVLGIAGAVAVGAILYFTKPSTKTAPSHRISHVSAT